MAETPNRIGPYEVLAELGRGGMGVVYRARDARLNRDVALKVIAEAAGFEGDGAARFRREAQAAAKLAGHPNIVGVHDIGEHEGTLYLAMQLIEGGTSLEDLVLEGELTPIGAAELMAKLARAVHHAHTEGILHRDLKPANVLVTLGEQPNELVPHVTDFGLARTQAADAELTRLTTSGELLGTPAYMSPEQARGEEVDARTDVYALGATLYEMLAGRPPFQADSVTGTLMQALREPPKPLRLVVPTAPRQLDAIVTKALEKEASHRYASAAAFAEDLERFVRGDSIVARIPDPVTRAVRWARRRPLTLAIGALVVAGGAFGAGVWWSSLDREQSDTQELTQTEEQRAIAERAARLSTVYSALQRETASQLRLLEDHWHGLREGADPRPTALAAVRAATDAAAEANPDLRLPQAWAALAQFFAGEEEPALEALAKARAEAGTDPFPAILSAQALIARYARQAGLPEAGISERGLTLGELTETKEMRAWRTQGAALLQPIADSPMRDVLTHGTEVLEFAAALKPFTAHRWTEAAAPLAALADDPLLGGTAGKLRGLALYMALDLEEAVRAWEHLGRRGWPVPLRDAGFATTIRADVARARGENPQPLLDRAGALLDRSIALNPNDRNVHSMRGITHRVSGDLAAGAGQSPLDHYEAALESYTRALLHKRGDSILHSNRGRVHRAIGDWMGRKRRDPRPYYTAALADYDAALLAEPANLTARRNRANCRKRIGRAMDDRGKDPRPWYRDAIADYDVTLAIASERRDPANYGSRATGWSNLAEAEMRWSGDPAAALARAESDATEWVRRTDASVQSSYERARIRSTTAWWTKKQGGDPTAHYARAFADFAVVQDKAHEHAWGCYDEGKARRSFGLWYRDVQQDAAKARALFERAVDLQKLASEYLPRNTKFRIALCAARQTLADAMEAAGEDGTPMYQLAIEDCNQVLNRKPRDLTSTQNRARLHWRMALALGEDSDYFAKAADDYRAAVQLQPRDVNSQYMVGKCMQRLKRWADAVDAYAATLVLEPKHRYAPARLKDCRAALDAQKKK